MKIKISRLFTKRVHGGLEIPLVEIFMQRILITVITSLILNHAVLHACPACIGHPRRYDPPFITPSSTSDGISKQKFNQAEAKSSSDSEDALKNTIRESASSLHFLKEYQTAIQNKKEIVSRDLAITR